jgi:hypothetical protein
VVFLLSPPLAIAAEELGGPWSSAALIIIGVAAAGLVATAIYRRSAARTAFLEASFAGDEPDRKPPQSFIRIFVGVLLAGGLGAAAIAFLADPLGYLVFALLFMVVVVSAGGWRR